MQFLFLCSHRPSNENENIYPALASRTDERCTCPETTSCIKTEALNEHEHFKDFETLETNELRLCTENTMFLNSMYLIFLSILFFHLKCDLPRKDMEKICLPSTHPMLFHFCYRVSGCR